MNPNLNESEVYLNDYQEQDNQFNPYRGNYPLQPRRNSAFDGQNNMP
jgi:hypothetical protein